MKVDGYGNVYAAGRKGIVVFDPTGKRLGTLKVPENLTSLAFGEKDRRTMYITTSQSLFKIPLHRALAALTADE